GAGGVSTHPVTGEQLGGGSGNQGSQDGVETVDLCLEALDASGQFPQGQLGGAEGGGGVCRTESGGCGDQLVHGGAPKRFSEIVRPGDQQRPYLVERGDAAVAGR